MSHGGPRAERVSRLAGEPRETAGVTSCLLLGYLDRVGGPAVVAEVLRRCGLEDAEAELRDENCWFSWETKIALLEATAAVLENPAFLDEMSAIALELNVGNALKVALRMLGSPEFAYRNVVRANARFNGSHATELIELERGHARIRFYEVGGGNRYHPLDCGYTASMLPLIPPLFGLPRAQLTHVECTGDGADSCVYDVTWSAQPLLARRATLLGAASAAGLVVSAVFAPVALPVVGGAALAGAAALGRAAVRQTRNRMRHLESLAQEHVDVAHGLFQSLQDLVSDLRLEEVVAKVTRNAQAALGGREFILLTRDGDGLACESSSGVPAHTIAGVEAWVNVTPRLVERSLLLDDVTAVRALESIAAGPAALRSLASAPLTSSGEAFGLLVALGTQTNAFLPRDLELLESYAAQVAIALTNARQYGLEKSLAACDPLTGLFNHRCFHDAIDSEIAACAASDFYSSVVVIDLDNFKRVNDEDGHAAGDKLLRAAARALTDACRHDDLAFRIGGDEFALLLKRLDERAAARVAQRVCEAIAGLDGRTGASAGVVAFGPATKRKADVLADVDRRLYDAKRERGRSGERSASAKPLVATEAAVEAFLAALRVHHEPTATHSLAVGELAERVATRLGAPSRDCTLARCAAFAHDIGKLAVARELLDKPGALADDEWEALRAVPDQGAEILAEAAPYEPLVAAVRAVHERWDGGGYPRGLRSEAIPLVARVVAVCDAYDAIVDERPYRSGRTRDEALAELRRFAGSQFDPAVVAALAAEVDTAALAHL